MIYCVLCGSHVPGHDMVQAWGATVCRMHLDYENNAPPRSAVQSWILLAFRAAFPENKPAPDIDIRG